MDFLQILRTKDPDTVSGTTGLTGAVDGVSVLPIVGGGGSERNLRRRDKGMLAFITSSSFSIKTRNQPRRVPTISVVSFAEVTVQQCLFRTDSCDKRHNGQHRNQHADG
jgi:hypothetical protein